MTDIEPIGTWDMFWYASKVLIALVIMVPLLYYALRYYGRRFTVSHSMGGNMMVLDVLPLGSGKQLILVKAGTETLVLATGKDNVNFICKLQDVAPAGSIKDVAGEEPEGLKQWVERWRRNRDGENHDHQGEKPDI